MLFSGPLGKLSPVGVRVAWPVLHISVLVKNRLNTTEFAIFISLVHSVLPNDLTIKDIFISNIAGVVPCGGL